MKVHIIGSGIIGLFSAYYLVKEGYEVELIDQSEGNGGCSFQNAGMIVPSHFVPLAAPGMVIKALKWMFDSTSPFYAKPRLDLNFLNWALKFALSANQKKVDIAMPVLQEFIGKSKLLYQEIEDLDLDFEKKGLLMLCQTEHTLQDEIGVAKKARELGMEASILDRSGVHQLEYESKPDVKGGVFYPEDAHCNPQKLISSLKGFLKANGVAFTYNAVVTNAAFKEGVIKSISIDKKGQGIEEIEIEELVLAAGSWSGNLAKILKLNMPIEAGKGYSFMERQTTGKRIFHPSILCEAKVAVTPFKDDSVRFAGTMEFSGINDKIERKRVKAIAEAGRRFYQGSDILSPETKDVWYGLRPCSPDGLPYIGRSATFRNLTVATGHAMLGISLGTGTGQKVAEIIKNKAPLKADDLFNPNRFGK
ncbi:MAG: D-amino-acid dehydrogenase [Arcticibacterium sp.]|jgi:D-amino-acid dehydrogenase